MDGDLNALLQVLAPDVNVWADSGGKARAAGPHPVHGRDKVAPNHRRRLPAPHRRSRRPLPPRQRRTLGTADVGRCPYMLIFIDLIPGRWNHSGTKERERIWAPAPTMIPSGWGLLPLPALPAA